MSERVAYLGPEGSFASMAVLRVATAAQGVPLPTIPDVIAAVRNGDVELGVVPIENSIEGPVNVTLDALGFDEPGVYIRGELPLPVTMALLARHGVTARDVDVVLSHSVALAQCRRWIAGNLPHAEVDVAVSTAEAARLVSESDAPWAALAPAACAERFGLALLAHDVHDYEGSITRFVVLGRSMAAATGADKTSIVVFLGADRPGLLSRILEEFALRGINLTKIESRPTKQQLGEYCIFFDAAGHLSEARIAEALRSIHRHVADVRVLGSYPRADGIAEPSGPADSDNAYAEAIDWFEQVLRHLDHR